MLRALYTAASGMSAQETNLDNGQQSCQLEHHRVSQTPGAI